MRAVWCAAKPSTENDHATFRISSCSLNTLWFGGAFIQFSVAQGNTLKILLPREERSNPIAHDPGGQRGVPGRDESADRAFVVLLSGRSSGLLPADEAQLALFLFFAACHFSQFAYNLPVLMRRRARRGWPTGPC
jgi:hypothetical protein